MYAVFYINFKDIKIFTLKMILKYKADYLMYVENDEKTLQTMKHEEFFFNFTKNSEYSVIEKY